MKKMLFSLMKFFHISFIKNAKNIKTIRGVTFEPRKAITIENIFTIDIPIAWIKDGIVFKNKKDDNVSYFFSDGKPKFTPSISIQVEDDDGDKFEPLIESFKTKIYGENVNQASEENKLYEHLDKLASKKYALYGPTVMAGSSFICFYHYGDIKKTIIIWINLVYVKLFSKSEWEYIMMCTLSILLSGQRIFKHKGIPNMEFSTYIHS